MLYLRRPIEDRNEHLKRRWRDYFINYLLPPLISAMIVGVVSIPYHLRINHQITRIEKELGKVAIIANRALEIAERQTLNNLPEALENPNTRKEFEGLERLTADSAQDTQQINNAQEPEPFQYQMEFILTYPQK